MHPLEWAWRIHVQPKWGKREVGTLRHSEVRTWVTAMTSDRRAVTVIRAYGVRVSPRHRCAGRRIRENPARGIRLAKKKLKPCVYLTHRQVFELAGQQRTRRSCTFSPAAMTTPRVRECARTKSVPCTATFVDARGWIAGDTQTVYAQAPGQDILRGEARSRAIARLAQKVRDLGHVTVGSTVSSTSSVSSPAMDMRTWPRCCCCGTPSAHVSRDCHSFSLTFFLTTPDASD
jgi:hypothetical protein